MRRIPLYNRTAQPLQIGLEPEGDCFSLGAGQECELRYGQTAPDDLEIEFEADLVSIHCSEPKEIWQGGKRVK